MLGRLLNLLSNHFYYNLLHGPGLFVGGSSGLNTCAAAKLAEESEEPLVIVTILCDLGVKYLSKVYNQDWLKDNGFDYDEGFAD